MSGIFGLKRTFRLKNLRGLLLIPALFCLALPASANMIVNGSFENNDVASGRWHAFSSSLVDGWGGSNIEIWDNYGRENAANGNQFIELNSHGRRNGGRYNIFQDLNTTAGQRYDLSFAYQARRNNREAFRVQLFDLGQSGNPIADWLVDDHTVNDWSNYASHFTAQSNTTRLRFVSMNRGTVGNFLDDISVRKMGVDGDNKEGPHLPPGTQVVSEPSTLLLLALGFIAVVSLKRKATRENLARG